MAIYMKVPEKIILQRLSFFRYGYYPPWQIIGDFNDKFNT